MNWNVPQPVEQENWFWLNEGVQWIELPVDSLFPQYNFFHSEYK